MFMNHIELAGHYPWCFSKIHLLGFFRLSPLVLPSEDAKENKQPPFQCVQCEILQKLCWKLPCQEDERSSAAISSSTAPKPTALEHPTPAAKAVTCSGVRHPRISVRVCRWCGASQGKALGQGRSSISLRASSSLLGKLKQSTHVTETGHFALWLKPQ